MPRPAGAGAFSMVRALISALLASICAAVVLAAGQEPVFRSSSDVVRVFTTVTDKDGRLVTTLTREAFEVRDEGKPQPIALFDNTPQPRSEERRVGKVG